MRILAVVPPFSVSFSLVFNQLQRSFLSPSFRKDPRTTWDYLFLHTPSTTRLPHLGICVRKSWHLEFVLLEYVLEDTTFHSLGYKLLCPTSLKFWLPKAGAVYSPRIVDYEMLFYHLEMRITDALQIGLLSIRQMAWSISDFHYSSILKVTCRVVYRRNEESKGERKSPVFPVA